VTDKPAVQYVTSADGVSVGYSVRGEGYPLVFMQGAPFSHVQAEWDLQNYRAYNETVGRRRKLVRFDSRGSGVSQRGITDFSIDGLTQDLVAVVDRLALDRFGIVAVQASGPIALNAAAVMPDRVSHLVLIDSFASGADFGQIPQVQGFLGLGRSDWVLFTESLAHFFFGWDAGATARRYAEFLRECVIQEECLRFFEAVLRMDLTHLLPELTMPAVVVHHSRALIPDMNSARLLASRIPNAQMVMLNGFWNDQQDDLDVLDGVISGLLGQEAPQHAATDTPASAVPRATGGLVTILFTDVEGSTALTQRLGDLKARELFREHERITRESLARFGGSEVKTMGDGFMASFGSATSALQCAIDMQRAFARSNQGSDNPLRVRIGLNAGEPIAEADDLFGTPVIIAARIAARAEGGEVLASNVVRELVAGRGFMFHDRGDTTLRGFEDPVRVFEVRWAEEN
jgi:class 3 adenylate cyclase/pimeloyl-ACP methyl ester carboxylesterase